MKTLFCFHGKTSPAALLVSQDSETAATLVSQINPVGVKLFCYLKPTFVFVPINVHATCWPHERKRSIHRFRKFRKTKPTRIKKRSRQKVSSTFCFAVCFLPCVPRSKAHLLFVFPFVFRVKAFNAIPYYKDKVYDPDPDGSYTKGPKAKLERL